MAHTSKIEWTEATWNPWHGCHKVSQGCKNCYMFRDKKRYGQDPNVVVRSKTKFYDPLKWTEPRTIFTCSWSDFFIEESDAWRDEAFAIMALTPQHTYQVLTKRPERMLEYFSRGLLKSEILGTFYGKPELDALVKGMDKWPLPNVNLGVSVEDQKTADERIPLLLQTPNALPWLSMEPLLGDVDVHDYLGTPYWWCVSCDSEATATFDEECARCGDSLRSIGGIRWVVAGGESGPNARPMHPDWVRSIRDQCVAVGVPFFFKQWGEWVALAGQKPGEDFAHVHGHSKRKDFCFPIGSPDCEQAATMYRLGNHNAGRILDGRTWNEMPEVFQ